MISVCIPVYNFDISTLITRLSPQVKEINGEIIVIDDASTEFKDKNRKFLKKYEEINYIELPKNIGRAAIRNLFLNYAKHNYLLFLDCDSLIISDAFISNYVKTIKKSSPPVICGGRIYGNKPDNRKKLLRWKYGIMRESKPAKIRYKNPNASFMSNNFVISKSVFQKIKFNENLYKYGHEDTLFGYDLKKNGIKITHIDNPVLNFDLEDATLYLKKTKESIINLVYITSHYKIEKELANDITILKIHLKLKQKLLHIPLIMSAPITLVLLPPLIVLTNSVTLLNLYKLILFSWKKMNY